MLNIETTTGLTFGDVILVPAESNILPKDVDISTVLTQQICLAIPFVSSAMDTVTESRMAIAMAQMGGLGIVHRNLKVEDQALEIKKVKKYESGVVAEPITIGPEETVTQAEKLRETYKISGFPVVNGNKLLGILTNRDLRTAKSSEQKVSEIMTPREELITAKEGVAKEDALKLIHGNRVEKLPIVDASDNYVGADVGIPSYIFHIPEVIISETEGKKGMEILGMEILHTGRIRKIQGCTYWKDYAFGTRFAPTPQSYCPEPLYDIIDSTDAKMIYGYFYAMGVGEIE